MILVNASTHFYKLLEDHSLPASFHNKLKQHHKRRDFVFYRKSVWNRMQLLHCGGRVPYREGEEEEDMEEEEEVKNSVDKINLL